MKRILVLSMVTCMLLSFAVMAVAEEAAPPAPKPATNVGDTVAPWTGQDIANNAKVSSDSLKGKRYAMVFVNASCAACRGELSDLVKMKFTNMPIFVVAVDAKPDRALTIYKDLLKIPYPVVEDSKQVISGLFDFYYTPASVIVDGSGKVEFRFGGYSPKVKAEIMSAFEKYAD